MINKFRRIMMLFILGFLLLTITLVLIYRFIPVAYTPLMAIRAIEHAINPNKNMRFKKKWVSIDKISPNLITAVISAEDQKFIDHHGFDFAAIKTSMEYNSKKNRNRIKGGSTISQQTAKNAFLWPNRDWIRKGLEAYFTILIEILWDKRRIMEVYLNIIEMGDGIYGAEAAAQYYFRKSASDINRYEAASIAAILPSPIRRSASKPSPSTEKRILKIQRLMKGIGTITPENL